MQQQQLLIPRKKKDEIYKIISDLAGQDFNEK
jgi:hypothetical protein